MHLYSPDGSLDQLYMSQLRHAAREGRAARVCRASATCRCSAARDYAMRIWIDPDKAAARDLTVDDIVTALRAQNVQVAAGVLGQPPVAHARAPTSSTSRRSAG